MQKVKRFFPFLRWFPLRRETLKADWIAGLTGGLVLVPQAMAYAQLAGLPPQYGLYTALLPGVVAALWGSSSKLSSGPVALVSILTGSALAPLAIAGSEKFIALAILLALLVGIVQLALGMFKLGVVINFISHPVIIGFTNAAAIIIALSQLNKLLGLPLGRSEHFAQDIWEVLSQVRESHIPSLLMGLSAFAIMLALKKYYPKLPGVLVAVVIATAVSWAIGFERIKTLPIDRIMDPEVRQQAEEVVTLEKQISRTNGQIVDNSNQLANLPKSQQASPYDASLTYGIQLLRIDLKNLELERRAEYRALRKHSFELVPATAMAPARLYVLGQAPAGIQSDGVRWHVKAIVVGDELKLVGGGEVVGTVPPGLPSFELPDMNWNAITTLISSALVISLVGFMEAISIAKAMATKSKERLDPNQELIGQGLANIVGSFTQSFPSSGSFARSAINFNAGAVTGFSTVFAAVVVLVTLLFLTPLLYHLPQAVLAAVIMLAVVNLVNFKSMVHAWRAHRHDGIAAAVTFIASLAFAPHLDSGILAGAGLAVILFLLRTMKPRIVTLGRHADGTLRDAKIHNLPQSEHIVVIRFDAALYFANAPYFEDAVLEASASHPKVKFIIILGDGMNQLDASGEEVIRHLTTRLRQNAITLVFVGLKRQVLQVMQRTRLYPSIGAQNFFRTEREALEAIYQWIGEEESFDAKYCPLTPAREPELDKVGAALNPGSQAQTSQPAATLTAEPTSVSAQETAPSRAKSA
jgi:SulP family sulfate permease